MLSGDEEMWKSIPASAANVTDASVEPVFVQIAEDTRIAMLEKARFLGEDRFRLLRHHLRDMRASRQLETLLVTSAIPQDGKSTIAINTATALADGGRKKVLLIEGDLHCPSLGKTLGVERVAGTAECLEQGHHPMLYLRKLNPLGFYFLEAGSAVSHPTDLIQSEAWPALLAKVRGQFDWIIVDSPPVCPIPDTLSMWKHVDGVLLVVRSGKTPRELADEAIRLAGPERLAAIVFNGSVEANEAYYKYSSYYGSKYGAGSRR